MANHFTSIATLKPLERTRVWFIQKPMEGFNYANLEEFGEIIFLLRFRDSPTHNPGNAIRLIREKLKGWAEEDYFVAYGGDPLGIYLTGAIMNEIYHNAPIRWLRWNRERDVDGRRGTKSGYYEPMRFGLYGMPIEETGT
jgi:hypothetical protein